MRAIIAMLLLSALALAQCDQYITNAAQEEQLCNYYSTDPGINVYHCFQAGKYRLDAGNCYKAANMLQLADEQFVMAIDFLNRSAPMLVPTGDLFIKAHAYEFAGNAQIGLGSVPGALAFYDMAITQAQSTPNVPADEKRLEVNRLMAVKAAASQPADNTTTGNAQGGSFDLTWAVVIVIAAVLVGAVFLMFSRSKPRYEPAQHFDTPVMIDREPPKVKNVVSAREKAKDKLRRKYGGR